MFYRIIAYSIKKISLENPISFCTGYDETSVHLPLCILVPGEHNLPSRLLAKIIWQAVASRCFRWSMLPLAINSFYCSSLARILRQAVASRYFIGATVTVGYNSFQCSD